MTRLCLATKVVATLLVAHGAVGVGMSRATQEPIVNCNQLEHQEDRCDCNMRVLRALNGIRVIVSDPVQSPNSTPANIQDAVQQERQHRLRTFIAPNCQLPASPDDLPL